MPTREEITGALQKARNRLFDKEGQPVLAGWNRKILYHFSDTDEYWAMLVVDGRPEQPALGEIEDADIRITVSTETFVGLMNGTINGLKAVTTGKVKVKAAMSDMRKMQVFM